MLPRRRDVLGEHEAVGAAGEAGGGEQPGVEGPELLDGVEVEQGVEVVEEVVGGGGGRG